MAIIDQSASAISETELTCLEGIIRGGLQSFIAVGLALIEIRETRGYRLRGHDSFENYCQSAFGFTARHGRRMMSAAKTADQVSASDATDGPANELVARVLAPVVGDERVLQAVKTRLKTRGMSLSNASGNIVARLIASGPRPYRKQVVGAKGKRETVSSSDTCPGCKRIPNRYVWAASDGPWQCGHCKTVVKLTVSLAARPIAGTCPRCGMKFDKGNPRHTDKSYCAYCAEELDGIPAYSDQDGPL